MTQTTIIILLSVLLIISYLFPYIRKFYISTNHLFVVRFYFKLLLFLIGILTFLFGIHDALIEEREQNSCYKVNTPPFIGVDNLHKEKTFSDDGFFDWNPTSKHKHKQIDYLIILDRTRSIDPILNNYLINYCKSIVAEDYQNSVKKFNALSDSELILAGIVHRMSFIQDKDIETIRLNVQAYNGDDKFVSLFNGNWRTLKSKDNKSEKSRIDAFSELIGGLSKLPSPKKESKTYFDEIYSRINKNLESKHEVQNLNIILLSDFVHEFGDENTSEELEKQINAFSGKKCEKISLVELPSKSAISTIDYSIEGINSLKRKKAKTKLYSWSHKNLNIFSHNELTVFFNTIISMPDSSSTNLSYNKDKVISGEFLKGLDCRYYSCEILNESSSNAVLSSFPTVSILDANEIKTKLSKLSEPTEFNLIYDLDKYTSKESSVTFTPLRPLPSRSISIFFITHTLLFSTTLSILFVYLRTSLKWNEAQHTGGWLSRVFNKNKLLQKNQIALKKWKRSFIIVGNMLAIALIVWLFFYDWTSTTSLMRSDMTRILLSIALLNIAPFCFYQFEQETEKGQLRIWQKIMKSQAKNI